MVKMDNSQHNLPWLHGGDLVAAQLDAEGIDSIFTLIGGHISPIYDGLQPYDVGIVDFRHEQAAVHAADAFARLNRRPAVAVLTAGPGVTGGITGVANAFHASSPVTVLGGRNPFLTDGAGNLQDAPHQELMRPITKHCTAAYDVFRIPDLIQEAIKVSMSGRFGPVYLDLPMDTLLSQVENSDLNT